MEVQVSPEIEVRLAELAAQQGRAPASIVEDALARYLNGERAFLEAVEKGIAAADRGEFIEEAEMDARVDRMLQR